MTQQVIFTGNSANDGTGDSLRIAFTKANDNFSELYAAVTGFDGNLANASASGTLTVSGNLNVSGHGYVRSDTFYFVDSIDLSKQLRFKLSGLDSGSVNTLTVPPGSDTLITANSINSFRYKTIDGAYNSFANVPLNSTIGILGYSHGGTGQERIPAAGELLIGTGSGYNLTQLSQGDGIVIDNSTPGRITISSNAIMDEGAIQDIVNGMFTGNDSEGIEESFDPTNRKIALIANNWTLTVDGDVEGHATVNRLSDTTLTLSAPNLLKGITTSYNGYASGEAQSVRNINFVGPVQLTQDGDVATISVNTQLTSQDVRDLMGTTIQGSVPDEVTGFPTDSGIIVNYVAENQTLELGVRNFNVTLDGDVTGTATVKRLQDITINTTTSAIKGIGVKKDDTLVGYANSIKTLNFTGVTDLEVDSTGTQANINVSAITSAEQIAPIVGGMLTGRQEGITATYQENNRNIDFVLNPIQINLAGAVVGSGNVTFTGGGNDGIVTINTTGGVGGAGGVTVADEFNVTGTVSEINFVGGGVTTAVSIDGTTATVYVPNSPAAEGFILATNGSENVQNARKFTAGTGIDIIDEGPGGRFIVSAASDAILAKSQVYVENTAIGQEVGLDFYGSQDIIIQAEDDESSGKVKIYVYSLADGWFREPSYDCGSVTDKYGSTLDMGDFTNKIINYAADLGTIS